jgi:hypothetical protein
MAVRNRYQTGLPGTPAGRTDKAPRYPFDTTHGTMMSEAGTSTLEDSELIELRWAYRHLEHPSLAGRLSNALASPIEEGVALLPVHWQKRLNRVAEKSICRSLGVALGTISAGDMPNARSLLHKFMAMGAGAAGGFFGPLTLLAELPLTTTLILRSIADIARHEGEDLEQPETRIACVQVFALGGRTREDEAADLGYYGLRITLGLYFERDILEFASHARGPHIPAAIEIVRAVAARFGVVISDKAAAQMVPIAGAISGAMLNLIFMKHYQDVARGHFIVRRLERKYGVDVVRSAYQRLSDEETAAEEDFSPIEGW